MDFSFVQITDHHIRDSETALVRGLSTPYTLRTVLRHIAQNVGDKIDFIFSTGDVTNHPTAAAYKTVTNLLQLRLASQAPGPQYITAEGLQDFPIYFVPGNHDDRNLFFSNLSLDTPAMAAMNLTFEYKGIQFICFDQGTEASAVLPPETIDFVKNSLANGKPSIVITHHHTIPVGNKILDNFLAPNIKDFWKAIEGANVLGVLFGHVHNTYEDIVNGIPAYGLRATSFQFQLPDEPNMMILPPHYRLVTIHNGIMTTRLYEVEL